MRHCKLWLWSNARDLELGLCSALDTDIFWQFDIWCWCQHFNTGKAKLNSDTLLNKMSGWKSKLGLNDRWTLNTADFGNCAPPDPSRPLTHWHTHLCLPPSWPCQHQKVVESRLSFKDEHLHCFDPCSAKLRYPCKCAGAYYSNPPPPIYSGGGGITMELSEIRNP